MAQGDRAREAGRVTFPGIGSHLDIDTPRGGFAVPADASSMGSISCASWVAVAISKEPRASSPENFVGYPDGMFTDHHSSRSSFQTE
jgi:hypothetical protein